MVNDDYDEKERYDEKDKDEDIYNDDGDDEDNEDEEDEDIDDEDEDIDDDDNLGQEPCQLILFPSVSETEVCYNLLVIPCHV